MAKTTKPETPRAKGVKRPAANSLRLTARLQQLEYRMDTLELTVIQKLNSFEERIIGALAPFSGEEYRNRNIFRALVTGIGIVIIGVLFYIDGN